MRVQQPSSPGQAVVGHAKMADLPLLFGTFLISQSIVSYASLVSLVAFGFSNRPSTFQLERAFRTESARRFWTTDVAVTRQFLERRARSQTPRSLARRTAFGGRESGAGRRRSQARR